MNDAESLFSILRRTADPDVVAAIEELVAKGSDRDLNRINVLAFANKRGFKLDDVIAAFLHASRLGIFEMAWNVLCPGAGFRPGRPLGLRVASKIILLPKFMVKLVKSSVSSGVPGKISASSEASKF